MLSRFIFYIRKGVPLQTIKTCTIYCSYKSQNILRTYSLKALIFTNTFDIIKTEKPQEDAPHGKPDILLRKSIEQGSEP